MKWIWHSVHNYRVVWVRLGVCVTCCACAGRECWCLRRTGRRAGPRRRAWAAAARTRNAPGLGAARARRAWASATTTACTWRSTRACCARRARACRARRQPTTSATVPQCRSAATGRYSATRTDSAYAERRVLFPRLYSRFPTITGVIILNE